MELMSIKNKLLFEGQLFTQAKILNDKYIDWLKNVQSVTSDIEKCIDKVIKHLEFKTDEEATVKYKTQHFWDNQTDSFKFFDIEATINYKSKEKNKQDLHDHILYY